MDPLSITVAVAGLLGLATEIIEIIKPYVRISKTAATELLIELDVLHSNLSKLDKLLKEDGRGNFSDTSVLVTSTHSCRTKLFVLHAKLTGVVERPLHRFRWPLSSDDHQKTLQELRAFAQWIQFALTVNGASLLSKSSNEVHDVLINQLQTFQLIDKLNTNADLTQSAVAEVHEMMSTSSAAAERRDILDWISRADYESKHHNTRSPRVEGTGGWLLNEPEFRRWRDHSSPDENVLWCHGIQGSVIDHLTSSSKDSLVPMTSCAVAYVYFDYREQEHQSPEQITRSLLRQLSSGTPTLPTPVKSLYKRLDEQQRKPMQPDLEQAFMATCQERGPVFIVVDALDECESMHRKTFLKVLDRLKRCAKILVTSRPYPADLKKAFVSTPQIVIKAHSSDLRKFLLQEIVGSENADDIDDEFREEIVDKVIQRAQDIFLLAVWHTQSVLSEPTLGEMAEALDRLPQSLPAAFKETMQRIIRQPESRSRLALNSLMWVTHARRPLRIEELSDALAIRPGLTAVDPKYRPNRKMIIDSCHGLVTLDKEGLFVRLIHYSVHGYLVDGRVFALEGNQKIAELCIAYQMMEPFTAGCCSDEDEIFDLLCKCPFIGYAAGYWGHHVRAADDTAINSLTLEFLQARPQQACSYQIWQYVQGRRKEYWEAQEAVSCNGLHVAAMFGLEDVAKKLLPIYDIDAPTNIGTTALLKAASCGHPSLTRLFLHVDADPKKNNWYGTALHCAAEAGWPSTIRELLDAGVDADIIDNQGRVPLTCAINMGHAEAIRILVEGGADVGRTYEDGETHLYTAIRGAEPPDIIRTLLECHANPNTVTKDDVTPLHLAVVKASVRKNGGEIVSLLLDHGADVNAPGKRGWTPIRYAVSLNCSSVLELLLDRGANVNAQGHDGTTALHAASFLASRTLSKAQALATGLPRTTAIALDVSLIERHAFEIASQDLVITLVPFVHHASIIKLAIQNKVNVVTTSYVSDAMRELDAPARAAGIVVLNEVGVDPGVDHLYAIKKIGRCTLKAARNFTPTAEDSRPNPLGFKFSLSPRGALLSQFNSAQFLFANEKVEVSNKDLMGTAKPYSVNEYEFVAYPNRNSLPFQDFYDIPEADTVIRGSLRYKGNPEMVKALIDLRWLDTQTKDWLKAGLTWAEVLVRAIGADNASESALVSRVRELCQFSNEAESERIISGLRWMGLFSSEPATVRGANLLDTLCARLEKELSYRSGERDLVMLQHKFVVEWQDGKRETSTSTLELNGDPDGYSAMAKSVGVTCGIAAQLLLDGHEAFKSPGIIAPYKKEMCDPMRELLEKEGIKMFEELV
ncbi:MAG: hypothetical protein Q9170_002356 [Blastenia crenularia]